MSLDLGDLAGFATAIGLVDASGNPVDSWFSDPGHHLSRILANPVQRQALVTVVDDLLGGSEAATDSAGIAWLPIVEAGDGVFQLLITLQETGGGATVRVGVGVRVRASADEVHIEVDAHVPLFAAAGTTPVSDPLLLGKPGAPIDIAVRLELPADTAPGRVALHAAELGASIPTTTSESPSVRLALRGLRMPGAAQARDLVVDAAAADQLDEALLELVLGLIQAQLGALDPASPLRGLASMLGLDDDNVPDFPIADLAARGPIALADWLALALTGTARTAWLGGLAHLFGGSVVDSAVEVTIAGAPVRIELLTTPGASARPVITPRVSAGITVDTFMRLALAVDLASVDLGNGAALAVPRLAVTGRLDPPGATKLLPTVTGPAGLSIAVGALEVGFALDANRRPVLVLHAEDADIGATHYDVLDLSTPEALAAAAGQVVANAAATLLTALGPAGDAVAMLLGLADLPAAPGLPRVDPAELLRDPVGAVRAHWRELFDAHAASVPDVLAVLRDALADNRVRGVAIGGTGAPATPWRVPLAPDFDLLFAVDGDTVTCSVAGGLAADLADTGLRAALAVEVALAHLDLNAGSASFLTGLRARLALAGAGGARLQLGLGGAGASLASLGLAVDWTPAAGLRALPLLDDARLHLPAGDAVLPELIFDAAGHLALDADGWQAIERLAGALALEAAQLANLPWLTTLVGLLGWAPAVRSPNLALAIPGYAPLSLAAIIADPEAALRDFAAAIARDEDALRTLLETVAAALVDGVLDGRGATARPWVLPLVSATGSLAGRAAAALPALVVTLGADGAPAPTTQVQPALRAWRPGDDGLDTAALVAGIARDAEIDDLLDDLLAGRGDMVQGLADLVTRWAATDGLVTLPDDGLPAGVTGHRPADLVHNAPLGGELMSDILTEIWAENFSSTAPAAIVYVAIDGADRPADTGLLPGADAGVPPEHVLDLTTAGVPPEAFTPPTPGGAPNWAMRLGSRAACRLASGDSDGVAGQAARLRRALEPLAGAGADLVVVAHGGAGHAAVRAVDGLAGVRAVVTVGTSWSPVAVDSLDAAPAGEALRLLKALLRIADAAAADPTDIAVDPDEPDDADLALTRGAVAALFDLDPFADPLADIRPPGGLAAPATIPVHAVVGSLSEPALRRGLTAVVAAALSARARARAAQAAAEALAPARAGLRLPFVIGGASSGLVARVLVDLDLVGVSRDPASPPLTGPAVRVRLDLGAATGWLVGGPDPGRGAGGARMLACRRLTALIELPIRAWSSSLAAPPACARLILHDATAFGTVRDRWTIELGAGAAADATALVPEARAIMAEIASRLGLAAPADAAIGALRNGLIALGVLGPDGGVDAITFERLLLDPVATVAAARTDTTRRGQLAAMLRAMAGDTRPAALAGDTVDMRFGDADVVTAHLDLAALSLQVTAGRTGALPWSLGVTAGPAGLSTEARIGAELPASGASGPAGFALVASASGAGVSLQLQKRLPGAARTAAALWPAPAPDAILETLTSLAPGLALGCLLDGLRAALLSLSPPVASAIDALLDAAGLLGTAGADGQRRLRSMHSFVADPAAWLRALPSGIAGSVPALVDAVRGLLGAGGSTGALQLVDGVLLRTAMQGGRLAVTVDMDATAFEAPVGGIDLVLGGSAGLAMAVGTGGVSAPLPDVGLSVGVGSVGALRLRVGPDAGGAGDAIGVTLALVPEGRPEIVLVPGGPGLAGLTSALEAGAIAALPALLDALASNDPAPATTPTTPEGIAGRVLARVGDALALREGDPKRFSQSALATFGADPAAALAARGTALAAEGLTLLTQAIAPLLGGVPARTAVATGGALEITVGPTTLRWRPGASRFEAALHLSGVPGIAHLDTEFAVTQTGLQALDVTVGPAELDAGVVTLAPYARVRVGAAPADGRAIEVGLGIGTNRRLGFRWDLATSSATLIAINIGSLPTDIVESADAGAVAAAVVGAVLDLAGGVVLSVPDVQSALGAAVLGTTVGALLDGVLLKPGDATKLDPALAGDIADPIRLLRRLGTLLGKLADAPSAAIPIEDILLLRIARRMDGTTPVYGVNIEIDGSWELNPNDDVVISLEEDATWIASPTGPVPEGLTVEVLALPLSGDPEPRPGLVVGGLGVRIARSSGPLLDAGISIASVAAHVFGLVTPGTTTTIAGGLHLELAGLGVALGGASGGDNQVAQGLMGQAGAGPDAPAPKFSPALAVQKHPGEPVHISLSAGPGSGPWWLTIQRQFGPIYLEQVGLSVVNPPAGIESVGILIDGGVSLMGLSASVDDLSLTYIVAGGGSPLDPSHWRVDLAGFAVAADIGGVSLAGGLRRFTPAEGGVEYLGMLMARVAVYGLSVYGGYGVVGPENDRFTAIFLFGAVNGPIGGPPAFFVTGIGGGFGINRRLSTPTDLAQFNTFPLIKALDPAARAGDPFRELAEARVFFAPERGTFWFAAGLSFNSFALVDGIAVIALQFGGGFELSLLGLARMALPRPEVALVSIEMALVARFSTREGIILVQAQLTDNSWLLSRDVRLTGGFAFASWFAGPNRGQFVVTMGGYHPDFHRDGYPIVPRLGLAWRIGDSISIVGESYFALTSEALMAGVRIEISASLGPAWAHVVFGGDGIIYFDPFRLKVTVYASIDAGVTIDVWIGEITISVHLSARIEITAPPFHAIARFEIGPVGLTLEIGDAESDPAYIAWDAFVRKYLEEAAPGRARVLTAVTGAGALPPSGSATTGGAATPDGTADRPFRVLAEFELTVTSTAPLRELLAGGPLQSLNASRVVSVAPMGLQAPAPIRLTLSIVGPGGDATNRIARLEITPQQLGAFPIGTWGAAPDPTAPTVPSGDVIAATDRVVLRAVADIPGNPPNIPYRQVETSARRLLPFVTEDASQRNDVQQAIAGLAAFVPVAADGPARIAAAGALLSERGGRSPADVVAWRADRASAPLLGSLGEGLGVAPRAVSVAQTAPEPPAPPPPPRPPRVRALLHAPEAHETTLLSAGDQNTATHTTVSANVRKKFAPIAAAAPTLAGIDARLHPAVPARLLRLAPSAAPSGKTAVAAVAPPLTRTVLSGAEVAAGRAASPETAARLAAFSAALTGQGNVITTRAGAAAAPAAHIGAGEIAILELPDAARDGDTQKRPALVVRGQARIVALGPAGGVAADVTIDSAVSRTGGTVVVPPATRSLVAIGLAAGATPSPVAGWLADVPLPSATDGVLIGAGCVLDAVGRVPGRGVAALRAGWVAPDELVSGESAVATTFAQPIAAVAVALEGGTGDDVALGVDGARRPVGPDGSPEPPVVVADGARAVLVFRLIESRVGTTLTVSSGAARRLAGVAAVALQKGGDGDAVASLAESIGRLGLAALVPPVATPGAGGADMIWKEA